MNTFVQQGNYTCECGLKFNNSQSFNGHKSGCRIHLGEEKYQQRLLRCRASFAKGTANYKAKTQAERDLKLNNWLEEQHTCETCGKIMTEKFATGRFCCRSCAAAHGQPAKPKISKPKVNKDTKVEFVPEVLDEIQSRKAGWQSRSIKNSYPEQFWMKVFDNNNIDYIREYNVKNENCTGTYKFDFLIDNLYDIEIDGGQHKDEAINKKDIRRDTYLRNLGYIIYRIDWIPPTS